jgi:hypothetical protein
MAAGLKEIQQVCDPVRFSLEDALASAQAWARRSPSLYLEVAVFLHEQCAVDDPDLEAIGRILHVIVELTPPCALVVVLRPILRECGPRLRSKCVLVLAHHEQNLAWAEKLMTDEDARVRASVVEGLWGFKSPEIAGLFSRAMTDSHHRVVANAVYGLHLVDGTKSRSLIEEMASNPGPAFRSAAAWVIRKTGSVELRGLLKPLLVDTDPVVRHAGFQALMALAPRNRSARGLAA